MSINDPTIDRMEAQFKELAEDVNRTSASARNGWIFFLAIQAYFFVALAGLTHRELLLDTPIPLPLLQVPIELKGFFVFGPFIFVLIHMGILLQHVMLARQARELHMRIANFEGRNLFRSHRVRLHLHAYFFTQLIAGPKRSAFFAFFLSLLHWLSFGILPVILLLDFQSTFLPYHDLQVTWAHRASVVADLLVLLIFSAFIRHPALGFVAGFGRNLVQRPVSLLVSVLLGMGAMFFSLSVATIPDERMDRFMTSLWPVDISDERSEGVQLTRRAFWMTAWLFDGGVDRLSGRPASLFGRNLIVTDTDLVKDGSFDDGETSINLRLRDLRYATFDRSDLHQADLTGANLTQASMRLVNLIEVKAERATFRGADLWGAQFIPMTPIGRPINPVNMREADLREANLPNADLRTVTLDGALLEGANLRGADMAENIKEEAVRQGARF
jgi:hypothetical protein